MSGDFVPYGLEPEFKPIPSFAEREASFWEYADAQGEDALRASPTSSLYRMLELTTAQEGLGKYGRFVGPGQRPGQPRTLTGADVMARAESKGLKLDLGPKDTYTEHASDILVERARQQQFRDIVVQSYHPSMATNLGVSVIASLADPLNIAAAFIPVVGEVRYAELLAGASSFAMRSGTRLKGLADKVVGKLERLFQLQFEDLVQLALGEKR